MPLIYAQVTQHFETRCVKRDPTVNLAEKVIIERFPPDLLRGRKISFTLTHTPSVDA